MSMAALRESYIVERSLEGPLGLPFIGKIGSIRKDCLSFFIEGGTTIWRHRANKAQPETYPIIEQSRPCSTSISS